MSTLLILIPIAIIFSLGYFLYGKFLRGLFGCNEKNVTPAQSKYDGVDYIPARNWLVLFGHHFSSIAGAAPIIGPIVAVAYWGWAPAIIWIVLGSILMGGVHDFGCLMVSVRHGGNSIAEVAKEVISPRAKLLFSVFLLLALILVIAVFAYVCADTFTSDGRIVIPSFGLIFIAMLVGSLLYKFKANQVLATVIGLVLLFGVIAAGYFFPVNINSIQFWMIILLAYAFIASIMPVHILLQPRDYLSCFLLFIGIVLGYLGLIVSHPVVKFPPFIAWDAEGGWLWPMLLVTIACGAISGFHSLIASGTTSKQLPNEKYAQRIGYGAMITEGVLAALALLVIIGGISNVDKLRSVLSAGSPIKAFGLGFGNVTRPLLGDWGSLVAITILNAFVLTTLDTATRIARYILTELTKVKKRFIITFFVVVFSGWLAWGGKWKLLWPVFGASNQLAATLALFVITCWLLTKKKPFWMVMIPAVFMLLTTAAALIYQGGQFFKSQNNLLFGICILLLLLTFYILSEAMKVFFRRFKK